MCYCKNKKFKRYEKPIVMEYRLTPAARLLAGSTGAPDDPEEQDLP